LVSPDIATCPECLHELFDPRDRRFHYPFINCTDCGPRFTIINSTPYDRPLTTMKDFIMCKDCAAEYADPEDRRFHAQPDACFDCGPALRLWRSGQEPAEAEGRAKSDALIGQVASLLAQGHVVAIKGLGGYHLACDATNEEAVAKLRARKRRVAKPFALMVRDLAQARALCEVNTLEAALLSGTVRPIVLLERRAVGAVVANASAVGVPTAGSPAAGTPVAGSPMANAAAIAPSVAGHLHELGIMLPSTPVQHLLMAAVDVPLVMTSGNISEEPIIAKEAEAHELLAGVADAFLDNDREILSRYDDSVVRVIDGRVYMIRRARGYAPKPLRLSRALSNDGDASLAHQPTILAVGPEQKGTFCLTRGEEAFCSQHLGDLENASSFGAWLATLTLYKRLFSLDHQVIACDMHPEYLSTKWARAQDEARIEVQHHHAHIASVLAEHHARRASSAAGNSLPDGANGDGATRHASDAANGDSTARQGSETFAGGDTEPIDKVIGIAFDGSGYGDDGTIWGGEVLIAGLEDFERFAHLRAVPLPGGRAAIDHPDRMAWSYVRASGLTEHRGLAPFASNLGEDRILLLDQIIAARINTPETSSMGRLFDAVSALAGVCAESSYEGQAAVELEAALHDPTTGAPVVDDKRTESATRYRFAITAANNQDTGRSNAGHPHADDPHANHPHADDSRIGHPHMDVPHAGHLVDPAPVLAALLDDRAALVPAALIALRFHEAVIQLICDLCNLARAQRGLSAVALSGGVFMNRYLLARVVPLLKNEGFTVLLNRELPANDGCISYGQAAVAAARLARTADEGILLNKQ
jgi:hydrogenase maturation protein HypF